MIRAAIIHSFSAVVRIAFAPNRRRRDQLSVGLARSRSIAAAIAATASYMTTKTCARGGLAGRGPCRSPPGLQPFQTRSSARRT